MSKYKYLNKRALYDLAVSYLDYSIPVCSRCDYQRKHGYEWLTFWTDERCVRFSVLNGGVWIKVFESDGFGTIYRSEILKRIS